MSIKDWPKLEKPREKLLHRGADTLSDAELLAIFIRTGTQGQDAIALARAMLHSAKGLRNVLNMAKSDFQAFKGIGETKYVQVQAALELGKRYLYAEKMLDTTLNSAQDAADYLKLQLRDKEYEVFVGIFLDNQHSVLQYQELFRGTINRSAVPIREVVKDALKYNCSALIVAHNHPSGVSEPSRADCELTKDLRSALQLVDVLLLDHLVVGEREVVSLAQRGVI